MSASVVRAVLGASMLALTACGGPMTVRTDATEKLPTLRDVTQAQWDALAQRRIFFAHQSVGGNIMDGVADIMAEHPEIRLNVQQTRDLSNAAPGFRHTLIGRNHYPLEKFDDFVKTASAGFGREPGIAMVKLCFTDVDGSTDARALFDAYQKHIATLRASDPNLTIVHFTMPLTGVENWKGRARAFVSRKTTQRDLNAIRQRYNELMRRTYQGREPLVDVAKFESTLPDGSRMAFDYGRDTIPMLVPQYTDDGSHLNATSRRIVAEQLLITLARLQPAAANARAN